MTKPKDKPSAKPVATAYLVEGIGTDLEIAERCAKEVEGWADLGEQQKADMVRLMRQWWEAQKPPRMEVQTGENQTIIRPAKDSNVTLNVLRTGRLMGSCSADYMDSRISDLSSIARSPAKGGTKPNSESLSANLAFVAGGNATDTVQSSLLVQMAATHEGALRALGQASRAEYVDQAKVFGNLSVKLFNAFTRQAEVLAKLQRGGEQVIKHVHIDNRGGQAVLAEQVVTGGGVNAESRDQPHGSDALSPALLGSDPLGVVVPMSSRERPEALPNARVRTGKRSAEG